MIKTHKILMYAAIFLTALAPQNVLSGNCNQGTQIHASTSAGNIEIKCQVDSIKNRIKDPKNAGFSPRASNTTNLPLEAPRSGRTAVSHAAPIAGSPRRARVAHAVLSPAAGASAPTSPDRGRNLERTGGRRSRRNLSPITPPTPAARRTVTFALPLYQQIPVRTKNSRNVSFAPEPVPSPRDRVFVFNTKLKAEDELLSPQEVTIPAARRMRGHQKPRGTTVGNFDTISATEPSHIFHSVPGSIVSPSSTASRRAAVPQIEVLNRKEKLNAFNDRLYLLTAHLKAVQRPKTSESFTAALQQIIDDANRVTKEDGRSFASQLVTDARCDYTIASEGLTALEAGTSFKTIQQSVSSNYWRTFKTVSDNYESFNHESRK